MAQITPFFLMYSLTTMASSSSSPSSTSSSSIIQITLLLLITSTLTLSSDINPKPKEWPEQFHSILAMNYSGDLQLIDLWYDWPNGRNFNIIQYQLGKLLYDLEWNNGTSFFYTLDDSNPECSSAQIEVGILRPNWLDGATYLGRQQVDGFVCNVWTKTDFITYYEDVVTKRPVSWVFYTGRTAHVMTFEVGAALEDAKWQVPFYCFDQSAAATSIDNDGTTKSDSVLGFTSDVLQQFTKGRSTTIGTVMHKALQAFWSMKAVL